MEMRNKPYRLVPLARLVLCKMYFAHVNDDPRDEFSTDEIAQMFSVQISKKLIRSALEMLRGDAYKSEEKFASRHKRSEGDYGFRITHAGILEVEKSLQNKESDLSYFADRGDKAVDEIAGLDGIFLTDQERAERDKWAPLDIDRADPLYKESLNDLEAVIESVRGDNGFSADRPEERNGILQALELGRSWLKDKSPSRAQISSYIINPLTWLAGNFSKAALGEVAKRAIATIVKWLEAL